MNECYKRIQSTTNCIVIINSTRKKYRMRNNRTIIVHVWNLGGVIYASTIVYQLSINSLYTYYICGARKLYDNEFGLEASSKHFE